jgi:preprotein translocase subunit SecA
MLSDVTSGLLDLFIPVDAKAQDWNVQGFITAAARQFGIQYNEAELRQMGAEQITDRFSKKVKELYDAQKVEIGDYFEQLSRMLLLQTIDQRWKEHLERIDQLKEGINLRAHAQLDPLIEYKKEAFAAFQQMNAWIQEETIEKLLKMRLVSQDRAREVLAEERQELDASELSYAGADEDNVSGGFKGLRPPAGAMAGGLPFRNPQPQQLSYGPADGGDDEQHLNREQRRQMKKAQKKKKLKI